MTLADAGRRSDGQSFIDRLTPQDLMSIWPEDLGWSPQDIGALAILDGGGLRDSGGRFRDRNCPRGDRTKASPGSSISAASLPAHVRAGLAAVGGRSHLRCPGTRPGYSARRSRRRDALLLACEELRSPTAEPIAAPSGRCGSFPLWRVAGSACLSRCTTRIADGVAGIAALGAFFDTVPDPQVTIGPPWSPRARPSSRVIRRQHPPAHTGGRTHVQQKSPIPWKPSIRHRKSGRQCMRLSSRVGRRRQA